MMKKISRILITMVIGIFFLVQSGCIGAFKLTRDVYKINNSISDKYIKELAFIVLSPVYIVATTFDALILNSIEFWTGENPMDMAFGTSETHQITMDGKSYILTASHNRFHLESIDKSIKQDMIYNDHTSTWSVMINNKSFDVCTYNNNGTVTIYKADNTSLTYTTDALMKMAGNRALALK